MQRGRFEALIAGLEAAGLSRKEIAERSGISPSTLWRMRNSISADHHLGTIERLLTLRRKLDDAAKIERR